MFLFPCDRYFLGISPKLQISDLDMLKEIMVKHFNTAFTNRTVSTSVHTVCIGIEWILIIIKLHIVIIILIIIINTSSSSSSSSSSSITVYQS